MPADSMIDSPASVGFGSRPSLSRVTSPSGSTLTSKPLTGAARDVTVNLTSATGEFRLRVLD